MALDHEVLICGAGFGGIYALYKLKRLGLDVKLIEKNAGVAGTWYANRYPGAMSDSDSPTYRYSSWDLELLKQYPFDQTYVFQSEVEAYLNAVVDRHNLREFIELEVEMTEAAWDDAAGCWIVTLADGKTITARYFITALGFLSAINWPQFKNINSFKGTLAHTGAWPKDLNLAGKKVGVIGNGSTGVQVMQTIAKSVGELVSFQRHPQYCVPANLRKVTPEERKHMNENWGPIWEKCMNHTFGLSFPEPTKSFHDATDEERRAAFETAWSTGGGFTFMFGPFTDIAISEEANEYAAAFIREKIAEKVKDPEKRRKLTPHDLYARRPVCDEGYYEIFNRDNVHVVLLSEDPIEEITPKGIKLASGREIELDVIVCATGFDAVEGNYNRVRIHGRGGISLKEQWGDQPKSYLGVFCPNFPNMFMVNGPLSCFVNIPPVCETQGDLITTVIAKNGPGKTIETTEAFVDQWIDTCNGIAAVLLFSKLPTWVFGANIPGRKAVTKFYLGGLKNYRGIVSSVSSSLEGLTFA